ncbi:MAG: GGDEF domain-containing protein [Proteobacteria bacterium]|nr:GGDEF domain-containing protein [Pseudomonadota bacterium]MBU1390044.1 GGDEF domain-containing protein [Pseudomonadota bacterium]MBU1545005.1 GGDEF domain-containing protein [Pseudomonadota bacterium]MBU2431141.1 GGDEF domain-containing protein [Pseudomonadota bacterium]MBU2480391.1 GGDEF domain-containing protein [Pseudomonadota bacterium]
MSYTEERTRAGEYLRLALGLITKYNLSVDPVNYTVWYEYVSGKNAKLKKALDLSIQQEKSINNELVEALYQKYVADGDRLVVSKLLTKISLMLKEIAGHVTETEGDLAGHGQSLGELAARVADVNDFNEMKDIVDQMLIETKELLNSGKRLQSRMKISSEDLKQLQQELEKSQQEAQTDVLTSLINRRGLEKRLELERIRARQNNSSFSIIMVDIDHFKTVNDTHGHLVGDSLLKSIAQLLKTHLRKNDIAARYGGEEFLILLTETGIDGAMAVGEKIRKALSAKEWKVKDTGKSMGKITVSMGVALYRLNEPEKDLIKRVDDALYLAKKKGRNQICSQDDL